MRALHAPVNTPQRQPGLHDHGVAWSIKASCALLLPVSPRWADHHNDQRRCLLTMEFRTFCQAFIDIPCQVVKGARRIRWRAQAWNPWLGVSFRLLDAL